MALPLQGERTQGGLLIGRAPGDTAGLWLGDAPVRIAPGGLFYLALAREAPASVVLTRQDSAGRRFSQAIAVAQRVFRIQEIMGLRAETVTTPPEEKERRDRELRLIALARSVVSDRTDWAKGWRAPVGGRITGVYGSQRILNGQPRQPHWGIDFANPTGTAVVAPAGGEVVLAQTGFLLEGGVIILDHGGGVFSSFLHLSRLDVAVGTVVAPGQRLGAVGGTGRATGPHLCWRVKAGDTWVDPGLLLTLAKTPAL
jgi:murein DD-endopeptidase MepM/ murein hydrolase activator NlpD